MFAKFLTIKGYLSGDRGRSTCLCERSSDFCAAFIIKKVVDCVTIREQGPSVGAGCSENL